MQTASISRSVTNQDAQVSRRMFIAGALVAPLFSQTAFAQSQQPIRIIVGAAAGGAIDIYVRVIAEHMTKTLGRQIVIESRPGAGGTLATQWVKDQPADGATLWAGTMAMTELNPHTFSNLRWSMGDFAPLIKGVDSPLAFVVHPSVPAKDIKEFVAWVKANPGKLSFASYSVGTPSHFLGVQMNDVFGLDMGHLPYRGSAPQIVDLVAGHARFGFAQIAGTVPHVEAGKLRVLATTGEKRAFQLPNATTFAELGFPQLSASIWFGFLVRKETLDAVQQQLLAAARAAHADPAVKELLRKQGFDVSGQETQAFAKSIAEGSARWKKLIDKTGFKVN